MRNVLRVTGRVALASLFLLGGTNKLASFGETTARMAEAGLTPATPLLCATIALEIVGGALVATGRRFAVPACLALAAFTLATNAAFHEFWTYEGERRTSELSLFFKNLSIAGALVYVAGMSLPPRPA